MREGTCNCLALFDWNGSFGASAFHAVAQSLFAENGIVPDVGAIGTDGKAKKYPRIIDDIPEEECSVDLYHTVPGYKQLVFGWDVHASMTIGIEKTMLFCWSQALAGVPLSFCEDILRRVSAEVTLTYGIGYEREFVLGPEMYAVGFIAGLNVGRQNEAERDRIGAWMRERLNSRRHLQGLFRDIYRLNVVYSLHLSRVIGGLALARWIEESRNRGVLRAIDNGAWVWELSDEQIPLVRSDLLNAGLLICV